MSDYLEAKRAKALAPVLSEEERAMYDTPLAEWRSRTPGIPLTSEDILCWASPSELWKPFVDGEQLCESYIDPQDQSTRPAVVARRPEFGLGSSNSPPVAVREDLNRKIHFCNLSLVEVKVGAITNAADESCLGGGGTDQVVHNAAGPLLLRACAELHGVRSGTGKITKGFNLPADYVIHVVGPIYCVDPNPRRTLSGAFRSALDLCRRHGIRSILFGMVGQGFFGYPLLEHSQVVLGTIRSWLEVDENAESMDTILLTLGLPSAVAEARFRTYSRMACIFFPKREEGV